MSNNALWIAGYACTFKLIKNARISPVSIKTTDD